MSIYIHVFRFYSPVLSDNFIRYLKTQINNKKDNGSFTDAVILFQLYPFISGFPTDIFIFYNRCNKSTAKAMIEIVEPTENRIRFTNPFEEQMPKLTPHFSGYNRRSSR